MSLLDDVRGEINSPGKRCGIARLLDRLDDDLAAELLAALNDAETYPGSAIARAMTKRGHHLTAGIIQHHRKGGCSCGA